MQEARLHARGRGFTLIEVTVSLLIGAMLMTAIYRIWSANHKATERIGNKSDFRNMATLATNRLNRSITMAGFGMTKMDVLYRTRTEATDTLIIYSNPSERRTTLKDTAAAYATSIRVFTDSGISIGGRIGITDSIQQEYATVTDKSGDSASGFVLTLSAPLQHKFLPGIPDIYPVQKETFFLSRSNRTMIRRIDDLSEVLGEGMTDFRIDLKDADGNDATTYRTIRVVSFALTGTYKAPQGTSNTMRFSSTVIPRNIL